MPSVYEMDTEKLILIAGVCVFAAALCRLFDSGAGEYAVAVKAVAAAGIMLAVISAVSPALERIGLIYEKSGGDEWYLTVMVKSLGICFLTGLAADICRDSGESALASQAEAAGKTALLIMALPLFERAAELVRSLI